VTDAIVGCKRLLAITPEANKSTNLSQYLCKDFVGHLVKLLCFPDPPVQALYLVSQNGPFGLLARGQLNLEWIAFDVGG
jgi:hypothetical protein